MVDPATQLDQGGNPLQEGIWANVDGGWQPRYKRDETFAKVASMKLPPSGIEPQVHGMATPHPEGPGIHNGTLHWLHFLDASINGTPVRGNEGPLFDQYVKRYEPVQVSVHHPEHLEAAIDAIQSPHLTSSPSTLIYAPKLKATGQAIFSGAIPAPPGVNAPPPKAPPVMSYHNERSLSMDPYLPWYHQASVERFEGDGRAPITLTDEEFAERAATVKQAIAPLLALGGRILLAQAVGGLMRKAIGGQGNFLNQGQQYGPPQPQDMGPRPVSLVASEHTAVGHDAPVETPHSTPDLIEDHDPESVDQQEFNDGDMDPAFQNPNMDVGVGGLSQSDGEDAMKQKLEFRHDGDAVQQAEMLLPLILEFVHSDKSGLDNPQIKALHEALEKEIPGYLDHADEDDEAVHKLLEELRKPEHVHAMTRQGYSGEALMPANQNPQADFIQQALRMVQYYEALGDHASAERYRQMAEQAGHHLGAGVYQNTMLNPGQMQMGNQQMAMPGTHANPVQPGGMPVSGRCMNCGGTLNADGSCPQCGANAGANQQGIQQGQQQTPLGIMPSPYSHTAADHQGPVTSEQKELFAEYLTQQGRQNEVAAMMANPSVYAEEWAEFLNRQTQPPTVDPTEQPPAPPPPAMDPSQMGQMPVPGMQIPQPTAKTAKPAQMGDTDNPRRCPRCTSATTSLMNPDGDIRCHRCGNVWNVEVTEDHPVVKSHWIIKKAYPDALENDSPNPVAAPAADATAPGDRSQQQDSSLSWQSTDGTPLQVGQIYEMHNPRYPIPDVVKVEQVKPDSVVVTMQGEYNSPSDPQDANGPSYTHEIPLQEAQSEGLTFVPKDTGEGEDEQSQDQADQDGIGQTVNTEPTRQSPEVPYHASFQRFAPLSEYDKYFGGESGAAAKAKASMIKQYGEKKGEEVFYATVNKKKGSVEESSTDECPKCQYGHVTSSYVSPEEIQYECFRCAHQWKVADKDEGSTLNPESRAWLNESDSNDFDFDRVAQFAAKGGASRNLSDIAARDPRNAEIAARLNKNAGAKFSPREQREFIDEEGVARNADRLNLDGTHYVESAFDNSKARPDRVNDNYLGLGL